MKHAWILVILTATCVAQFTVTNPSKIGPQQESIYRTLDFASANMDTQCSATLPMVQDMIKALEGDRVNSDLILVGHGIFEHTMVAAFTGNGGNVPAGYMMVIADNGAFFTDKTAKSVERDAPGSATFGGPTGYYLEVAHKYRGGSNAAKVEILLHELSHAVGVAEHDYHDSAAVDRNDKRILDNCGKVLKLAEKYKGVL